MAEAQFTDIVGQTLTKHPGSLAGCPPPPPPPSFPCAEREQCSSHEPAQCGVLDQCMRLRRRNDAPRPAHRESLVLKNLRECRCALRTCLKKALLHAFLAAFDFLGTTCSPLSRARMVWRAPLQRVHPGLHVRSGGHGLRGVPDLSRCGHHLCRLGLCVPKSAVERLLVLVASTSNVSAGLHGRAALATVRTAAVHLVEHDTTKREADSTDGVQYKTHHDQACDNPGDLWLSSKVKLLLEHDTCEGPQMSI